ncbi:glycosyltransferase family 2 protein [Cellulomonas sp. P5_E12]
MTAPRVLIVVPAWNEEETITAVLAEIADRVPDADVLVVNDGSTDRTSSVVARAGVPSLDLPFNLGVGGAMRAGFRYAAREQYTAVVQVDADGQHNPADVPRLVAELDAQSVDIVIGARFADAESYDVRGPRRWAMRTLSATISRIAHHKLTDTTSGFKAYGPRAVHLFASDYPAEYLGDTVEALVIAARSGLKVTQIGVTMRERAGGRPSHGPLKSTVFLGRAALALLMALSRPSVEPRTAEDL